MEKMYRKYNDIVDFYIVYISEAHAEDDKHPVPYAKKMGIREHKTYEERCSIADRLRKDKELTVPCLVDGMDNQVEKIYKGWPDRVYLIRKDGGQALQLEGQFDKPADLDERNLSASRVRSPLQPAIRFVDHLVSEQELLDAELFEVGPGGGDSGLDHAIQGVLGRFGKAGFEGRNAGGPVPLSRKTPDGAKSTAGVGSGGGVGTPALETQIGGERREGVGRFTGLTLPGAHRLHKVGPRDERTCQDSTKPAEPPTRTAPLAAG